MTIAGPMRGLEGPEEDTIFCGGSRPDARGGLKLRAARWLRRLILRQRNTREGDPRVGRHAKPGGMACGQSIGEVLDIFFVAGGVIALVRDQHRHLHNTGKVTARLLQKAVYIVQRIANLLLRRVAPKDSIVRIMRGRVSRNINMPRRLRDPTKRPLIAGRRGVKQFDFVVGHWSESPSINKRSCYRPVTCVAKIYRWDCVI